MSVREMALGSELAKETLLLLESAGWCKGKIAIRKSHPERSQNVPMWAEFTHNYQFCLRGAMVQSSYQMGLSYQEQRDAEQELYQSFDAFVGSRKLTVWSWNDLEDTTWEDVRAFLLAAIDVLTEAEEEQE